MSLHRLCDTVFELNKILLIDNNFDFRYNDGVGRYSSELYNELNRGHQGYEFISTDDLSKYKNPYLRFIDTRYRVKKAMKKIEDLKVIHLIKPEDIITIPKIPYGVSLLVSWHDLIRINEFGLKRFPTNKATSHMPNRFLAFYIIRRGYVRAYKKSSVILAVSTKTRDEIVDWANRLKIYDREKDIVIVNPGINHRFIESTPYEGKRNDFVYIGNIYKSTDLLNIFYEIHLRLPDQKLHIFTNTENPYELIHDRVRRDNIVNIMPNIRIHVNKSDDDIIDKTKRSIALLHTVGSEGFGFTILETLALGTPVIILKGAKITPEVSRYTFKLDKGEIPTFCEQLYLSQAPAEQQAISYAKSFTYKKTAQSVKSIYERYL